MEIKYKPTKQNKEKKAKTPKEPKAPKVEKPIKIGSAQKVKIEKPKKVKEPKAKALKPEKLKTTKPEKVKATKPEKVEKVEQFKATGKLKKNIGKKGWIAIIASSVVLVLAVVLVIVCWPKEEAPIGSLQSMTIVSLPDDTEFEVGEEANWYGLRLKVSLVGGGAAYFEHDDPGIAITGFDSSKPVETQIITVTYKGLSTVFSISIVKKNETNASSAKLIGIKMKDENLPQTEYHLDEVLDINGGKLTLLYDDGGEVDIPLITDYLIQDFTTSDVGTHKVNIMYDDYTTYYEITVSPASE